MVKRTDAACLIDIPHAERIARLNDQLRTRHWGGQIMISRGVDGLTCGDLSELLAMLAQSDRFDGDNDPYFEHDFGSFKFRGADILWKIDYYGDGDLRSGSSDPANPDITWRILTVFLASEY